MARTTPTTCSAEEIAFVHGLLSGLDATASARAAGITSSSRGGLRAKACKLRKQERILAEIARQQGQGIKRAAPPGAEVHTTGERPAPDPVATRHECLVHLTRIARAKISDLIQVTPGGLEFNPDALHNGALAGVEKLTIQPSGAITIHMASQQRAIETLLKEHRPAVSSAREPVSESSEGAISLEDALADRRARRAS